jgi:hypothetical protein
VSEVDTTVEQLAHGNNRHIWLFLSVIRSRSLKRLVKRLVRPQLKNQVETWTESNRAWFRVQAWEHAN